MEFDTIIKVLISWTKKKKKEKTCTAPDDYNWLKIKNQLEFVQ